MKVRRRGDLNSFGVFHELNGMEIDISSIEDLKSLDWINSDVFYKKGFNGVDYIMKDEGGIGYVVGYIFQSGNDLKLETWDHHVGLLKLKQKLKN